MGDELRAAKSKARVLLYAVTGHAPGVGKLLEALQAMEDGRRVVLVLENVQPSAEFAGDKYCGLTVADLDRARSFVLEVASSLHVKVRALPAGGGSTVCPSVSYERIMGQSNRVVYTLGHEPNPSSGSPYHPSESDAIDWIHAGGAPGFACARSNPQSNGCKGTVATLFICGNVHPLGSPPGPRGRASRCRVAHVP